MPCSRHPRAGSIAWRSAPSIASSIPVQENALVSSGRADGNQLSNTSKHLFHVGAEVTRPLPLTDAPWDGFFRVDLRLPEQTLRRSREYRLGAESRNVNVRLGVRDPLECRGILQQPDRRSHAADRLSPAGFSRRSQLRGHQSQRPDVRHNGWFQAPLRSPDTALPGKSRSMKTTTTLFGALLLVGVAASPALAVQIRRSTSPASW